MSTRDPFLTAVGVVLDRTAAFLVVAALLFVLLWDAIWGRWLGQPGVAWAYLQSIASGTAYPLVQVLFGMAFALSLCGAMGISFWLFHLWKRRGELGAEHLRGTRMER